MDETLEAPVLKCISNINYKIGAGIEFVEKGSLVTCISRRISSNPRNTARLTIGKQYEVQEIRFYARREDGWGFVEIENDIGKPTNYPLHRFRFDQGINRAMSEEVSFCIFCMKRSYTACDRVPEPCECRRAVQNRSILNQYPHVTIDLQRKFEGYEATISDGRYAQKRALDRWYVESRQDIELREELIKGFFGGYIDSNRIYQVATLQAIPAVPLLKSQQSKHTADPRPLAPGTRKIKIGD